MVDYWVAQIRRGFAGVDVLRAVVFLVMLLGIADRLASGVVQRTRELGAARAVGSGAGICSAWCWSRRW